MTTHTAWLVPVRHLSPASFERYLEKQAARGRHVRDVDALGVLRLRFDEGIPSTVRYVLDRRSQPAPADYFRFRESSGWEHAGALGDLHVWRQEYTVRPPLRFIGDTAQKRAGSWSVALGVLAAICVLGAVALGILAAVDPVAAASPRDFWAPAVALAVVGVIAVAVSLQLGVGRRETPAFRPLEDAHDTADEPARR